MPTGLQELKLIFNAIYKAPKHAQDLEDMLELTSDVADFKGNQDTGPNEANLPTVI